MKELIKVRSAIAEMEDAIISLRKLEKSLMAIKISSTIEKDFSALVEIASKEMGITDFWGNLKRQNQEFVRTRQMVAYIANSEMMVNKSEIGRRFRKDHSTIVDAIQKHDSDMILREYRDVFNRIFTKWRVRMLK